MNKDNLKAKDYPYYKKPLKMKKYQLTKADYALYLAYTIWILHEEILNHMEIAAKGKDFDKHFVVHMCNVRSSSVLIQVIERWFPKHIHKNKSVKSHYEWAKKYIEDKLSR